MILPHKKVRPKEFTGFLLNPHKGCATFQRFNGDPLSEGKTWSESGPTGFELRRDEGVTPGYLPSTVAYCRWFWEVVQPEADRFDWTPVERALETAHERGQTLEVRLMPHGSATQPSVPRWYQDRYPTHTVKTKIKPFLAPVYDGPEFIEQWGRVVSEFGSRFDGHPDLESVDIAYIGPWGEGAGECSEEGVEKITEIYRRAHAKTPLVAMITGHKMMAGVRAGAGWRCDCFGDLGIWHNPNLPNHMQWNHHYDCYPEAVCECGAQDAWKHAPVVFETCSVPMTWYEKGFDIGFILRQGLKFHGSVFMPKSTALPEAWMDLLRDFTNDLGYRYVLRQFKYDARVKAGTSFDCTCWIENVGVAPIYRGYTFAVKLTQNGRTHVHRSDADIKTWLPGDAWLRETVPLPNDFRPGNVMLHAGLIDSTSGEPKVRFANEDAEADGWLPLDTIEIREP